MNAEIICVGTELLLGSILDTHAQFISKILAREAIDVYFKTTVGDNPERLAEALRIASKRSDLVITCGGLGPTADDITVSAWSLFLNSPLRYDRGTDRQIRERLKKRSFFMNGLIKKQCLVLTDAHPLVNHHGTAPGQVVAYSFERSAKWGVLLPGPPKELEPMFADQAMPLLLKIAKIPKQHFLVRTLKITGETEAQTAVRVSDLLKLKPPVTLGIYTKPSEVELVIMSKARSRPKASQAAALLEKEIRKRLGDKIYGVDAEDLPKAIGILLRKKNRTLAVAESCTGGLSAHLITDTPGSSDYFLGGVIAYANEVKIRLLDVSKKTLGRYGAVSREVALQMARQIRLLLGSDYGIGITGICGPSGETGKKPVGLVYIALSDKTRTRVATDFYFGARAQIKYHAAHKALELLRLRLIGKI